MSLLGLMDIAKTALATSRQVLTVTGHNIANVNTPGFSRQEAVLIENRPQNAGVGQVGTGVDLAQIRRSIDTFLESQVTTSYAQLGRQDLLSTTLLQIQPLLSDTDEHGIGPALNQFFDAVQDVATNPSDPTARSALLSRGAILGEKLSQTRVQLSANRSSLDREVSQVLGEINRLSDEIADLNVKIVEAEIRGQNANDFRDQRQVKLNELSERVSIQVLENASGQVTVFVGRGQVLVDGHLTRDLVGVPSAANDGLTEIAYDTGGSTLPLITPFISSGRLKGLIESRDQTIPDLVASLDTLSASLVTEFNRTHRTGYGLDGSTGNDFFTALAVTARDNPDNAGTASIGSGTITAHSLLTQHRYEIRFSSASTYTIIDTDTGTNIRGNYTGAAIATPTVDTPIAIVSGSNDTLAVTVDGTASGVITLTGAASPGLAYTSGETLAQEIQTQINADATLSVAGRSVTVTFDRTTSRFVVTSNSTASTSVVNVTGGTAAATLGLSAGTSTAASGTFASPQTFNLDGISVTLTGATATDDVFTVDTFTNAAANLSVSITDHNKIAASASLSGVPSNNGNALALSALKNTALASLGNTTVTEFFSVTASTFGTTAQKAQNDFQAQEFLHQQLLAFRAQTSGVSLDEELVKMIEFQQAFEAASRMIIVADELMQTLLSIKR